MQLEGVSEVLARIGFKFVFNGLCKVFGARLAPFDTVFYVFPLHAAVGKTHSDAHYLLSTLAAMVALRAN